MEYIYDNYDMYEDNEREQARISRLMLREQVVEEEEYYDEQ